MTVRNDLIFNMYSIPYQIKKEKPFFHSAYPRAHSSRHAGAGADSQAEGQPVRLQGRPPSSCQGDEEKNQNIQAAAGRSPQKFFLFLPHACQQASQKAYHAPGRRHADPGGLGAPLLFQHEKSQKAHRRRSGPGLHRQNFQKTEYFFLHYVLPRLFLLYTKNICLRIAIMRKILYSLIYMMMKRRWCFGLWRCRSTDSTGGSSSALRVFFFRGNSRDYRQQNPY
ncbi:MAG: hypothetical protein U0N16_08045 [Desulfovibrio sp.]